MRKQSPPVDAATLDDRQSSTTRGVMLLLAGIALMSTMDAVAKFLVEDAVHVAQLLFVRSVLICLCISVFFGTRRQWHEIKPVRLKAQCLRGLLGFIAPFSFFTALEYLPLTSVNVVFYSSILMMTILSAIVLKEQVGRYRWTAVAVGYIGVFIAIDPGQHNGMIGYILVLVASAAYAGLFISGKALGKTESSVSLVLFYNLGVGVVSLFWLPGVWENLDPLNYLYIFVFSMLALVGQYCMTHAYTMADASLLAPLDYTSLVWAVFFDLIIWTTWPDARTMAGAAIIIFSALFVIHRERRRQQYLLHIPASE